MLNAQQSALILKAARALAPEHKALAESLLDMVANNETTRANMAAAQATRRRTCGPGRAPTVDYVVELDGHWQHTVTGAKAALALVTETLNSHGYRHAPALASFTVMMARKGAWFKLLETDTGQWGLTVTRQIPAEAPTSDDGAKATP